MGSKAAATPTNTTQTVNSNTIPDFMRPYFNTMMSASQNQVYQTDASGQVTGMKPYQPYSTNGADYVAPLSGLQNQAINSAGALQVPGQFQQGMDMVGGAGAQGMGAGAGAMGLGMQSAGAGAQYNQMATDPNSIQGYMSPYMQNVVDYQTQQANRQYDITGQQQQMDATRSGAFGGSREAIMGAENERNRNQAITGIQATGAQNAFQNAQQAQQFGAGLNLQGLNQGIQGMQTGIAGAQQGINAGLGLGTLGAGQLGAQRDIIGTQAQQGALQQGQQQQAIDAAVQNQQQAQAYPMQQIDFLSNLMRGNPTNNNSMVTNSTVQPSMASQMFGGIGALGSLYGAYKKKRGGIVGYSVGGAIESDLSQMSPEQLQEVIQSTTSDIERQLAKKLLAEKTMAGGGIVAFADKGYVPVNHHMTEEEAVQAQLGKPKPRKTQDQYTKADIKGIVQANADKYGVDPNLMMQTLSSESNYDAKAMSPKGAFGIAQFMPDTAKRFGIKDRGNIDQSIEGMAKYHKFLSDKYNGDPALIAAGYNAGEGRVDEYLDPKKRRPLPKETTDYMAKVTGGLQDIPVGSPQEEPAGIAQAPLQVTPSPESQQALAMAQQDTATAQRDADKTYPQRMAEVQANREAAGVGTDEGTQQYRKDVMAERANSKDEAKRQFHLRMADFFAHWGSTPGPVIAAGLKALTETMPSMIEDKDKQEKLQRDLDKSLYEVNHADYLEREGKYKEATALKESASERLHKSREVEHAALAAFGKHMETLQGQQNVAETYGQSREAVANIRGPGGAGAPKVLNEYQKTNINKEAMKSAEKAILMDINLIGAAPEVIAKARQDYFLKAKAQLYSDIGAQDEAQPTPEEQPAAPPPTQVAAPAAQPTVSNW